MYKLDKETYKTYKDFFFYGIDESGKKQVLDSILFFTYYKNIFKNEKEQNDDAGRSGGRFRPLPGHDRLRPAGCGGARPGSSGGLHL